MAPTRAELADLAEQSMLLQLIVVIAVSRLIAAVFKRLGQAEVVGEMLAGIVLGPSLVGYFFPEAFSYVFTKSNGPVFTGFAQLGLLLLMFQVGLEYQVVLVKSSKRVVVLVSAMSIVFPFALGLLTAPHFHRAVGETGAPSTSFLLIFAVSMSITALPVLVRILDEIGLQHTRPGAIAIGAAAIDDVVGWTLLGAVSLLHAGDFSLAWVGLRVVGILAVGAVAFYVLRPLLHRFFDARLRPEEHLRHDSIAVVLVLLCACGYATSQLGLHALIGGFIFGVALHRHQTFVHEWKTRIGPLVNTLFLPIFFTHTGLRTDIGSIRSTDVLSCALIIAVAFLGKFGGGYLGARLGGERHGMASLLGTCMNTRGLMELVVLNVGYDLGLLPKSLFTMLVYMAVFTTVIATPMIRRYLGAPELKRA